MSGVYTAAEARLETVRRIKREIIALRRIGAKNANMGSDAWEARHDWNLLLACQTRMGGIARASLRRFDEGAQHVYDYRVAYAGEEKS